MPYGGLPNVIELGDFEYTEVFRLPVVGVMILRILMNFRGLVRLRFFVVREAADVPLRGRKRA